MSENKVRSPLQPNGQPQSQAIPQEQPGPGEAGTQAAAGARPAPDDKIAALEEKNQALEEEARSNYDKYLRVAAEFDNAKKRSARQMEDFRKFANESILKALLPVVDNLERAIASAGEAGVSSGVVDGVSLTLNELLKVFENFGVKQIAAADKHFDPTFHQAVMQEPSGEHPDHTVLKELQKGYTLHDRLLRPAMVVVSKAAGTPSDDANAENPNTH